VDEDEVPNPNPLNNEGALPSTMEGVEAVSRGDVKIFLASNNCSSSSLYTAPEGIANVVGRDMSSLATLCVTDNGIGNTFCNMI
jgi:hypothetical protein